MTAPTYAAYIRISRLADGDHSTAPEQRAAILAWMSQHYPGAPIRWYEDIDQSGRSEARPDWQRLLTDLAIDPALRGVVVFNYTKTHRDVRGFLSFYDDHLAPRGQRLIDISNPYLNLSSADGRMQGTIFAAVAEHHARKTSELLTASLHHIKHRDGRQLGRPPFGADRDPATKHLLPSAARYLVDDSHHTARPWSAGDPIPPGWQVRLYLDSLRRAYELYSGDIELSYDETAVQLNAAGWRAWGDNRRDPVRWTSKGLQRILKKSALYASGPQPGGWEARHVPILEPDLCARVQARVASRAHHHDPRRQPATLYLLSGLIYCGECGERMAGHSAGTTWRGVVYTYRYYDHLYPEPHGCTQRAARAEILEATVLDRLAHLPASFGDSMLSLLDPLTNPAPAPPPPRLAQAQTELERLIDLHITGLITQEQFIRRRDPLQNEIERLQTSQPLPQLAQHADTLTALLALPTDPTAQRDLIRACVQRLDIMGRTVSKLEFQPWLNFFATSPLTSVKE